MPILFQELSNPEDLDYGEIRDEMVSVAYAAGDMMLAANPGSIATGTKLNCECPFHPSRTHTHV